MPTPSRRSLFIVLASFILVFLALEMPLFAASKYVHPNRGDRKKSEKHESKEAPPSTEATPTFIPKYPAAENDAMKAAFNEADQFYRDRKWSLATQKFEAYLAQSPYTALSDAALYRLADIADISGNPGKSREYLNTLIEKTPDPEWHERALLLLARSLFSASEYQNAYAVLSQIKPRYLAVWQRVHFYSLLLKLDEKRKEKSAFYPYYMLRLFDAYSELSGELPGHELPFIVSKDATRSFLESWASLKENPQAIPSEITQYVGGPAEAFVRRHMGKESGAANAEKYRDGLHMGLMLPLSGPYASFGHAILRGIRCATGEASPCEAVTRLPLIIRDTEGTPELAERFFREFADNRSVEVIVGLLSSKGSEVVAPLLDKEGSLALIEISNSEKPSGAPSNFFHLRLSPSEEIDRLVNRALSQGLKSIGILHPDTGYGKAMANLFETKLREKGGRLAARQSYAPNGPDMATAIQNLKLNVNYFPSGTEANGFQAIFIPDSGARVRKLSPFLSNENLLNIPLIGTSAWTGEPFSSEFETLFPKSFFPDIFYGARSGTTDFISQFSKAYGHGPSSVEALAYDITRALGKTLSEIKNPSRKDLVKALERLSSYTGVTGFRGFDEDGKARFDSYLLTQENGRWKALP